MIKSYRVGDQTYDRSHQRKSIIDTQQETLFQSVLDT